MSTPAPTPSTPSPTRGTRSGRTTRPTARSRRSASGDTWAYWPSAIEHPDSQNWNVLFIDDSPLAAVKTETAIPPDSSYVVRFDLPPLGREGVFTLRAVVDALKYLLEGRPGVLAEENNAISRLLVVGRVADLEVRSEEIEVEPAVPGTSARREPGRTRPWERRARLS